MILPKKTDIDKQKNDERKRFIDEGVILATKVDKLRETSANEEKQLKDWRESSLKLVQTEIAQFIEEKETIKHEIDEARLEREELLKPLTKEWKEINEAKSKIGQDITENYIIGEQLKEEERKLDKEKKKLSNLISNAKQNETETEKAKQEAVSLKELAHREYEMAREEHICQTDTHEKELSEVLQQKKEYKVALKTIEIRESQVKEKESDLLIRENNLQRRLERVIAYENKNKIDSTTND
jgi:hypothetical protein